MRTSTAAAGSAAFFIAAAPARVALGIALGQALLFDGIWLVVYAAIGWVVTTSFVRWYEEPHARAHLWRAV